LRVIVGLLTVSIVAGGTKIVEATRTEETGFTAEAIHFFSEGKHSRLYQKFGGHIRTIGGRAGVEFAVWAPNAKSISVVGDFNGWNTHTNVLEKEEHSGVWRTFVPGLAHGTTYKYRIESGAWETEKLDPITFFCQPPFASNSVVWELSYDWGDEHWMRERGLRSQLQSPISIYQVHLGSWMRVPEEQNRWLTYREIAPKLADYVHRLGFTHVEFLPLAEHTDYDPLGYTPISLFAPTNRYGTPQDLMFLIDYLHQREIAVILTLPLSRFSGEQHGLSHFDEAELYGSNEKDQESFEFDFSKPEVRSFLLSNALFWLDIYHIDGLRVASETEDTENAAAVEFLRTLNIEAYRNYPDIQTFAAHNIGGSPVSRPTYGGGLGFGYKWNDFFTENTAEYFSRDPIERKFHHAKLTSGHQDPIQENLVLAWPSEFIHQSNASLLARMAGDEWQKFANLRLLFAHTFLQPGKKLVFMGQEFGQWQSWKPETSVDWHLLDAYFHQGIQRWVAHLNNLYRSEIPAHEGDAEEWGFEPIDFNDAEQSVISWIRKSRSGHQQLIVVLNCTPLPRQNYRIGAPLGGFWRELLNSDSREYGGTGQGNFGGVEAAPFECHGKPYTLTVTLPPLAALIFRNTAEGPPIPLL
jgi:1,4-alpha-glucan branching enzyme